MRVWAVKYISFEGTFLQSLWSTEEAAIEEQIRLEEKRGRGSDSSYDVFPETVYSTQVQYRADNPEEFR